MEHLKERLAEAIKQFWLTREEQNRRQGSISGRQDYGSRSAVTGGAQLNGFTTLVKELLIECKLPDATVHIEKTTLPGYFRPTKDWDLVAVVNGNLIASIEFKSQVGPSFGNNFNNRVEEALGSATDIWTAYREGAFKPSQRPWLGYLMLLEDHVKSTTHVKVKQPHFNVLKEFHEASYMKRYELFCERLLRERLYDAACFIMSDKEGGLRGQYKEPSEELSFENFATSLMSHAIAFAKKLGYS